MLNIIKFDAKLALQNPKLREGIKKVAIKSYNKAKPIIKKNIEVAKKTSNQTSPLKNFESFKKKYKENMEKKLIICASTHEPEEKILVEAFEMLDDENILLVLAPRHPERVSKIFKELKNSGFNPSLFSKNEFKIDYSNNINLIDEIGYLEDLFSLGNIAFIGGSLIPRGGQNFLEAVKFSLPISSGKSFYNFQEIAEDLISMEILQVANSAQEIKDIWKKQLSFPTDKILEKTEDYLRERQGASSRAFEFLSL